MAKIPEELTSRAKPHPIADTRQYSAYNERPGYPKNSGQGYLFRNQAPAMTPAQRYPKRYTREGDALPREMYHGTVAALHIGQQVEPGHESSRGERGHRAMHSAQNRSSDHVYAATDPAEAYQYARDAAEKSGGTPRVYGVSMSASHTARDPEYARNKWDSPQWESVAHRYPNHPDNPHSEHAEDDPENPAPYDDSGNYIAFRTKKPMRVKRDVSEDARQLHEQRNSTEYGDNW